MENQFLMRCPSSKSCELHLIAFLQPYRSSRFPRPIIFLLSMMIRKKVDKGVGKYQATDRAAPRSSFQFKVGPPFPDTKQVHSIVSLDGVNVLPSIQARVDRGFDLHQNQWIGYKRNYFALVASFSFLGEPFNICNHKNFFISEPHGRLTKLTNFQLRLVDVNLYEPESGSSLVQHTSKRDKGPQFDPPAYTSVPGNIPLHDFMKLISNIRKNSRVQESKNLFFLNKEESSAARYNENGIISLYPLDIDIAKVARYERIQFLGSKNKSKGSIKPSNSYRLVVELLATTEEDKTVVIAFTQSPPLVIRGRSPANYAFLPTLDSIHSSDLDPQSCQNREESSQATPLLSSPLKPITNNVFYHERPKTFGFLDKKKAFVLNTTTSSKCLKKTSSQKCSLEKELYPDTLKNSVPPSPKKNIRHYFVTFNYIKKLPYIDSEKNKELIKASNIFEQTGRSPDNSTSQRIDSISCELYDDLSDSESGADEPSDNIPLSPVAVCTSSDAILQSIARDEEEEELSSESDILNIIPKFDEDTFSEGRQTSLNVRNLNAILSGSFLSSLALVLDCLELVNDDFDSSFIDLRRRIDSGKTSFLLVNDLSSLSQPPLYQEPVDEEGVDWIAG